MLLGHETLDRANGLGALDVEQDCLHAGGGGPDAHARGDGDGVRYDGPKHTGSNPWSAPESV